jgi:hypothetical protein
MGTEEFVSAPSIIVTELIKNHLYVRQGQQQDKAAFLAPLYRNLVKACKAWVTMPRITSDIEQAVTSAAISRRQGDEMGATTDFTPAFIAASEAGAARARAHAQQYRTYGYRWPPRAQAVTAGMATPAAANSDDDDDDVVMTKEVSFEEAMLLRREAAERNGCMVDLTEDLDEEEKAALLEQSDKEVRSEAARLSTTTDGS